MKNLKILLLFFACVTLQSCNNEGGDVPQNAVQFRDSFRIDSFLKSYYKNENVVLQTAISYEDEIDAYQLQAITINNSVVGYYAESRGGDSYFADVDLVNDRIYFKDFSSGKEYILNRISTLPEFNETRGFDFIHVAQSEVYRNRRPMFGTRHENCVTESIPNGSTGGYCTATFCDQVTYFFWFRVERINHIMVGQMNC